MCPKDDPMDNDLQGPDLDTMEEGRLIHSFTLWEDRKVVARGTWQESVV